jgi:uncharacterized protein (DUF2252 family)
MASDLALLPRTTLEAQLCGDAHASNFGFYASPERSLVFDVNDFDETLPGPFEWDLKRLTASLEIVARQLGVPTKERTRTVAAAARTYREAMAQFAAMPTLDLWYSRIDAQDLLALLQNDRKSEKELRKVVTKATSRTSLKAAEKLTTVVDGERRFVSDPPLLVPLSDMGRVIEVEAARARLTTLLEEYRGTLLSDRKHLISGYRLIDMAHKVVGVGSVGRRAWVMLLQGRTPDDILLLQAKEAVASVLEDALGPAGYPEHGQRVVAGQRLMQANSDILLGNLRSGDADGRRDYYVRQLRDWKGAFAPDLLKPEGLRRYGILCARTLARGHARSGDPVAIRDYLGTGTTMDDAIAEFSAAYADLNEQDLAAARQAAADGRITVAPAPE